MQIVNHEEYNETTLYNDISAVKPTVAVKLGRNVEKVTLPKSGSRRPPLGTKVRISG